MRGAGGRTSGGSGRWCNHRRSCVGRSSVQPPSAATWTCRRFPGCCSCSGRFADSICRASSGCLTSRKIGLLPRDPSPSLVMPWVAVSAPRSLAPATAARLPTSGDQVCHHLRPWTTCYHLLGHLKESVSSCSEIQFGLVLWPVREGGVCLGGYLLSLLVPL